MPQVGWFPTYTITEDYALSCELKMAGFKGRYLPEYLAVSATQYNNSTNFTMHAYIWCRLGGSWERLCSKMPTAGSKIAEFSLHPGSELVDKTTTTDVCAEITTIIVHACAPQVGEAPEEVRAVMRQHSRWCKGHMQVSHMNPSTSTRQNVLTHSRAAATHLQTSLHSTPCSHLPTLTCRC
jgi:cellulose synthase/poly-beta-1,6-N-acetylglucosamine synthase-like glycosyltransferase